MLFVFDNNSDVERIMENQPSSFDKHLVVLEKFDEFLKLKDLAFDKAIFWVQVHDIPIHFMSKRVAESICNIIGEVWRSSEPTDDNGGNFMSACHNWYQSSLVSWRSYHLGKWWEIMGSFLIWKTPEFMLLVWPSNPRWQAMWTMDPKQTILYKRTKIVWFTSQRSAIPIVGSFASLGLCSSAVLRPKNLG